MSVVTTRITSASTTKLAVSDQFRTEIVFLRDSTDKSVF